MSAPGALDALSERLASGATVKSVFGEPVTVGDKVIIPVARKSPLDSAEHPGSEQRAVWKVPV